MPGCPPPLPLPPAGLPLTLSSSLDEVTVTVFQGAGGSFGHSVAQVDGGVLVGAPLEQGGAGETGRVYQCRFSTGNCQDVPITAPPDVTSMSLGLSLVANGSQFLACSPAAWRACGVNMELRGFCFHLPSDKTLPVTLPACPRRASDIVFLVDGSGSIAHSDFERMKTFITQVMRRFESTDTHFALMQFSSTSTLHFDFATFARLSPAERVKEVQHITQSREITCTASAIRTVVDLFILRKGAREGAHRILIVVTDGRKYGDTLNYEDVIPEAVHAGIIRYAIGVGSAFVDPAAEEELRTIASKPSEDHVFRVDNFDALQGIQNQLQEKIFAIEGTQSAHSSSFQLEMAQEGFSALLTPEGPVLGAVGAYGWSGGVFVYNDRNGGTTFVNVSRDAGDMNDAYLGYAAESLSLSGTRALALGAPRYRHVGRLLLFLLRGPQDGWQLAADATGPQVGSYFGASLCALDLNGDRSADLVLVGAPMFYGAGSGGRVAVCTLRPKGGRLPCQQTLQGQPGHPLGRFGASLARLGDIDGDRWPEVAVGAPLEDEERGAVYIFRGQRGGISSQYSQRISGARFSSGPRYFGQAISSGRDLTGDRLPDMAVGAQGQVLLLRYALGTHLPPATAWRMPWPLPTPLRLSPPGPKVRGLRRRLHGGCRERPRRGGLGVAQPAAPAWGTRSSLCAGQECPQDTLTPLLLRLTYDATGNPIQVAGGLRPALSEDSEMVAVGTVSPQLPFAKDCGTDNICIDDLQMSFNFSGLETIVVGMTSAVDVTVTLHNRGEDSYRTTVQLQHAEALSYRKAVVLQVPRPPPPPPKSFRASKTPRSRKDHPEVHTLPPRSPPDIFTSTQRPFWPPALLQTSPDHPPRVVLPTPVPTPDAPGPFSVLQEVHVRALQLGAGGGSVAQDPLPRQPPHLPLWHQGRGLPSVPVSPKPPRALGDVAVRWAGG
uniref:VWFA domain-containing protein n=1 Tax=Otus sunia TaxID=257818 RepID=A0A8C8AU20_9STRI